MRTRLTSWALTGIAACAGLVALAGLASGRLGPEAGFLLGAAFAAGWWFGRKGRTVVALPPQRAALKRFAIAEALLATIPDPVILVDRRAIVIEANAAARRLLPTLKLGHPLSFALRSPDVLDGIEEVLRTGTGLEISYVTRVPTERAFEVQIRALAMPDRSEGELNIVLFLRDLTAARRLETMRVDFVANASHELRTPLAALLGFIETLQGPAREDARAREQFLGIMRAQAQRMTGLIDALLSLSRIELREHVPPTDVLDLAWIARQICEMHAPLARERGIALTVEAPDAPCWVLGDRDELERVVENLVQNAVTYGGSGGLVAVSLHRVEPRERSPQIALHVRDVGPGIAAEHIPRLTERFYRVDVGSSRAQGGTGLGLAIVKHVLNRHRGRLEIESEPGAGTVVRAILPAHRAQEAG